MNDGFRIEDIAVDCGLFELVPFNIAIIDRNYRIVAANNNFVEYFGPWQGRFCYEAYKGLSEPCPDCQTRATLEDGLVRVTDSTGVDRHGRVCHYVVHLAPLRNRNGEITHVIEMSTDVTETKRWQREYNLLFERASCYISVIDKNWRIIRANEAIRSTFGDVQGRLCYEAFKRRRKPCIKCPARETFIDAKEHAAPMVGVDREGAPAHYMVSTSPLSRGPEGVAHVIEIATDVTTINQLKEELRQAHDLYVELIRNANDGIIALDATGKVKLMNPAAAKILGFPGIKNPGLEKLREALPDHCLEAAAKAEGGYREAIVRNREEGEIPANWHSSILESRSKQIGYAIFLQDLREIKKLEKEKLDAERLAAVGQTVAGLAHTIKNLLMGLEGGMYMVDSGLKKNNAGRISEGWDILQRNFEKTTVLVRNFLEFSKGRLPELSMIDPVDVARSVVELYSETAAQQGIRLLLDAPLKIRKAPIDAQGMEACLTNLISNGIDAVHLKEGAGGQVIVRVLDDGEFLIYRVEDNGCGMEPEVKQRVFTTFFTTKGGKGTGLGLLTTRKIVSEHGGTIEMTSTAGSGTTFQIILPRKQLNNLWRASQRKKNSIMQAKK